MFSSIFLRAEVLAGSGNNVGEVQFLVGDSNTNRLTHLIVKQGIFDIKLKVAAVNTILNITGEGRTVQLDLADEEVAALPDFIEREPAQEQPYTPPSGVIGGYSSEILRKNTELENIPPKERRNIPENSFVIREGADANAPGDLFTRIDRINFEPGDYKIVSVIVEQGRHLGKRYVVPMEQVHLSTDELLHRAFTDEHPLEESSSQPL